jgi:dihydrofolate reductase
MGKVICALSMSLDGFIAGPNDGLDNPLGDGGQRLFAWMNAGPEDGRRNEWLAPPEASAPIVDGWAADTGAMISGRRTFDIAGGWRNGHPIDAPIFVVTHEAPTEGDWSPQVTFVTDGIEKALELAQAAAGDRYVSTGAADTTQQLLRAGKVDEIEVSLVPCLLGGGVRLLDHFGVGPIDLEQVGVIESDGVTHLRYRVVN